MGYYLRIAQTVSLRGDCRRSQVGAVVVLMDKRTAFFGYNGTPTPGVAGCLAGACPRGLKTYSERPSTADYSDCIGVHAERNATRTATSSGADLYGASVYVTREPCEDCKQLIFGTWLIKEVFWLPFGQMTRKEWWEGQNR